jgi:threonine/homoserine/homoserine lactone efflux protein
MEFIILFFTGITIGITGAMIPGPLTFFTATESLKSGKYTGLKTISGHIAIELVLVLLIFFGFQKFFASDRFLAVTYALGGLALITMGAILILNASKMKIVEDKKDVGFSKGLFLGGVFFSAVSPGFIVWWATIGVSTIVKALLSGVFGVLALVAGHWLADALWYWLISYAVDKGKSRMTDKSYHFIVRFFSVILILIGIYFIVNR